VASRADLEPEVAGWEPELALLADDGGLVHLHHLVDESPRWLRAGGALVLEMAPDQVPVVAERASRHFAEVDRVDDLAGRPRAIVARSLNPLAQRAGDR
jgi:release factor glutamine methyltransferase